MQNHMQTTETTAHYFAKNDLFIYATWNGRCFCIPCLRALDLLLFFFNQELQSLD